MNKERYKYFKWTPRTAWISFMYAVFVPSVVGYVFAKTDVSWDFGLSNRVFESWRMVIY